MRAAALATILALGWAGCELEDPPTQVSIENAAPDGATVTLVNSTGDSLPFGEVPAGTSTAYSDVPFVALRQVQVTVDAGTALEGTVDLSEGYLHIVTVSDTAPPTVQVIDPPTGRGGDGGGDPGAGPGGGW